MNHGTNDERIMTAPTPTAGCLNDSFHQVDVILLNLNLDQPDLIDFRGKCELSKFLVFSGSVMYDHCPANYRYIFWFFVYEDLILIFPINPSFCDEVAILYIVKAGCPLCPNF